MLTLQPENNSKAKVSSLTHFAEAEFGNVILLMLKQQKRTDMNTFLHTEDELRASVEEGTRQVEAGQFYTDAQVKQMLHQRNLQLA